MVDLQAALGGFAALQQINSLLSITLQLNTETNVHSLLENETLKEDIFLGLKYTKNLKIVRYSS